MLFVIQSCEIMPLWLYVTISHPIYSQILSVFPTKSEHDHSSLLSVLSLLTWIAHVGHLTLVCNWDKVISLMIATCFLGLQKHGTSDVFEKRRYLKWHRPSMTPSSDDHLAGLRNVLFSSLFHLQYRAYIYSLGLIQR